MKNINKEGKRSILDNNYFAQYKKNNGKEREEDEIQSQIPHAMSLAIEQLKCTINQQNQLILDRVNLVLGDLVEPLEMYISHHDQTSN
jgi:hypothetical protein